MTMKNSYVFLFMLTLSGIIFTSCGGKGKSRMEEYNSVGEFKDGYAIASYNGANNLLRYVIVNQEYEPVTAEMKEIDYYSDEFWIAKTVDNKYVGIDRKLDVIPFAFQSPEIYKTVSPRTIWAEDSAKSLVLVDLTTGNQLGKAYPGCEIDQVLDNGSVVLKYMKQRNFRVLADGYAMIDANGNELVPLGKFTFIGDFHNGLATYSTNGYGIPLSRTNCMHQPRNAVYVKWYELGNEFGIFGNCESNRFKQGYINEMGEVVIPQQYVYARPFDEEGFAIVGGISKRNRNNWGYHREYSKIDRSGNVVATNLRNPD